MSHYGARRLAGDPNTAPAELLVKGSSVLPNVGAVHFDRAGVDRSSSLGGTKISADSAAKRTYHHHTPSTALSREVMNPMALIMEMNWRNKIGV